LPATHQGRLTNEGLRAKLTQNARQSGLRDSVGQLKRRRSARFTKSIARLFFKPFGEVTNE